MTASPDDWLAAARPAERTVQLCLRGDLQAEFEELDRQLESARKAQPDSLAGGTEVVVLSQKIEAVRERMQAATVTFRLRALPRRRWRQLMAEHPPRRTDDGKPVETDVIGVNAETFFDPLVRECTVEPQLTEEQWVRLLDEVLSDRQFDLLMGTAWALNRHDVAVPTSRAASRILQSYAVESSRRNDSASPTSGSPAGNPGPSSSTSTTSTDD